MLYLPPFAGRPLCVIGTTTITVLRKDQEHNHMLLRHAAATDVGQVRDHNEDTYAVKNGDGRDPVGALFVVCDGMGGYERGEVASDVAAKAITAYYNAHGQSEPEPLLRDAFAAANGDVLQQQGNGDMGTTAVAALVRRNIAMVANVGDCRAYLVRDGQPRQLTRDHSFVAEQVAAGILTAEQAKMSSFRNIVTRAIGNRNELEVDLYGEPLQVGDVLVLCSDGLHGQVDPDEIALAVTKVPLDKACQKLVELANARGGPDNITIVAARVEELDEGVPLVAATATTATIAASAPPAAPTHGTNGAATTGSLARHAPVAPPLAPPVQRGGGSGILWLATLLMVAALGFGGYTLFRTRTPAAPPPAAAGLPTLTPPGAVTTTPDDLLATPDEAGTALLSDTLSLSDTLAITNETLMTDTATVTDTPALQETAEPGR